MYRYNGRVKRTFSNPFPILAKSSLDLSSKHVMRDLALLIQDSFQSRSYMMLEGGSEICCNLNNFLPKTMQVSPSSFNFDERCTNSSWSFCAMNVNTAGDISTISGLLDASKKSWFHSVINFPACISFASIPTVFFDL